jgi:uncharacterized membrane protein
MSQRRRIGIWASERGAIAPFAAIILVVAMGAAALSTDVGSWYAERRNMKAATDAAVLGAVVNQADLQAQNVAAIKATAADLLARNDSQYDASNITSLDLGTYCADRSLSPSDRFRTSITLCPGDTRDPKYAVVNAARIQVAGTTPSFLSRVLSPAQGSLTLNASSTAARIDEAAFQAGTGLVSVDTTQSALLNGILGGLLGTSIKLTAVQYQGLLNTNVQALGFLNALATQLNLSAGTYDGLLSTNVKVGDVLQAAITALNAPNSIASLALGALKASIVGSPTLQLGDLLDLGVWRNQPVGGSTAPTALDAGLNLYQLVSLALQVANGKNAISIPSISVGLPGILSLEVTSTVIEPPQSPPFAFGPVGVSVHTAQVRLQLKLKLLDLFGLLGQGVQLPLYVEVAAGDAVLSRIDCGPQPATDAKVTIDAKSGAVRAYIGTIDINVMKNFSQPIKDTDIQPAPILDLSLLGIVRSFLLAKAEVDVGSSNYTSLVFNQTQIAGKIPQSVTSTGMVDNLLAGLSNLQLGGCGLNLLGLCILPLDLNSIGTIIANLHQILDPVINGLLDPIVDGLLAALGIKLGYMDVTVTGVRCGVPVLVQ